jgi:hypothetical protein
VRTKQRAAVLVEQRAARDRTEAYHDARALALELARGVPSARFDPMRAGVVLQSGETVYRQLPIWIRVQEEGRWADASSADVLVTDLRLLCRFASGRLTSLWWNGIVGLHVDLAAEHIVLDYGDGQPVGLSGVQVAPVAVAGVALTHGLEGLLAHPAMVPLRGQADGESGMSGRKLRCC